MKEIGFVEEAGLRLRAMRHSKSSAATKKWRSTTAQGRKRSASQCIGT